jgi:hypothetical protein
LLYLVIYIPLVIHYMRKWSIEWNNKIGGKICHDDKKLS